MTTTFQNMRDTVIGLTKRPELVSVTDYAIAMATLRAHHVDFFPRDYANFLKTYTPPTGNQLFVDIDDFYTDAPLFRTADFAQSEDPNSGRASESLGYLNSYKEFWDNDNQLLTSHFTQMGESLRFLFAGASGRVRIFYYKNPNVTVGAYASWIANNHMEELAHWAAGIVWARSGFKEMAQAAMAQVETFKALLVESYLSSKK